MPDSNKKKPAANQGLQSLFGRGQMPKRLAWGVLLTIALLVVAFLLFKSRKPASEPATPPQPAVTNSPGPATNAFYEKLKGRWLRPDGEYVLQINNVDADGTLDAAYFNPNRIHVARARAFKDEARIKVFVELRDVNYPGCTYTLLYDAQRDRLNGVYYQAALQQEFEIEFERLKD